MDFPPPEMRVWTFYTRQGLFFVVMPAKAGCARKASMSFLKSWMPAFAGMTQEK
jgi:hypothetical protein